MPVYSGTVDAAGGNYEALFDGHGPEAWTDINPNSFFKDPNILVPAADVTRYTEDQDLWDLYKRPREMIYTEIHNNITFKYRLSLTFLVMPQRTILLQVFHLVSTLVLALILQAKPLLGSTLLLLLHRMRLQSQTLLPVTVYGLYALVAALCCRMLLL